MKFRITLALLFTASGLHGQAPANPQAHDQVTVTANRSSVATAESAKTVQTLDSAQLHDYPAVTLDESLRQHAGFELFRRASSRVANPTSEGISLRGLGSTAASRTLVLEDGAPLNDPFGGWVHWGESPQAAVHSVTLVTGGGSDLYGSSALAGVIDVVPASPSPARLELSGTGGSQFTSNLSALATHTGKLLDALLAGESLRTGGYVVTAPGLAGVVDVPANVESQSYRTELGRRDHETQRLFATGNLLNESRSNGTPLQTNATRLWRYLVGFDPQDVGRATTRVRLFGSDEGYRQSFSSVAAGRSSELLTRQQRVRTEELGATADATVRLGHLAAVAGADVRDIRGSDRETPIARGTANGLQGVTARQRFVGGFAELLGERKGWSGAASLRADQASNLDTVQTVATLTNVSVTTPPDRTEIVLSPRVGLVRAMGANASLHASGFRAFRSPSMNELYRTGQVGQEITLANPALRSERATGYEIGTQWSNARSGRRYVPSTLHATYFWTEINRPVSAVLLSQTATTITNQRENLGQIRSRGVELAADVQLISWLALNVGYQYADATVTRFAAQPALVGNRIPQVPAQSFTAQVRARSEHFGELTLAMRRAGRAFDDAGNQFPLDGFFSLDLSGHRRLGAGPKSRHLEAFFLLQNVTGERAQVARTPILTLGSPLFAQAGLRLRLGGLQP